MAKGKDGQKRDSAGKDRSRREREHAEGVPASDAEPGVPVSSAACSEPVGRMEPVGRSGFPLPGELIWNGEAAGRMQILNVAPLFDGGAFRAKSVPWERFEVSATVFREGHDQVSAEVLLVDPQGRVRPPVRMTEVNHGLGVFTAIVSADPVPGESEADVPGDWWFAVQAWSDPWATWRHAAEIKIAIGQDVELVCEEGARLFDRAAKAVPGGSPTLQDAMTALRDEHRPGPARLAAALAPEVLALLALHPVRELVTVAGPYGLKVERRRALVGSWYEFFPRSEGAIHHEDGSWTSGTFDTAIPRLEAAATMGFDVVYLPPIHPIGQGFRKGPNNTLNPGPHDPGVPWAIGSSDGGHDTVHPNLGGMAAFDRFMARAEELGVDIALDLALQVSPDHPWVSEHPDWFSMRVDGSIAYAENPPKKYQDIYPINFDHDPQGIFNEVMRIVKLWISHGVRIFRVDNPHTKPVAFWERLFRELAATNPDVLFLAEAFTRPPMMAALGKAGFHQSYTYFTWRNSRWELEEYLTELSGLSGAFMRPNLFTNTPDILSGYLVEGGRSAFLIRSLLAATLSPTWGIYAGFELCENAPLRPGSEEYLDSEKYQYRPRDWAAASEQGHSIAGWLTMLNRIRASHVSLQRLRNLTFHHADDDSVLVFSKTDTGPDGSVDTVLVICLLDPHNTHETLVRLDMPSLGLDWHASFIAEDHISGEQWTWGVTPWVRLSPDHPAHVVSVRR